MKVYRYNHYGVIIKNSIFASEEIERERGVILQELASGEDTPDDVVFDYYYETLFKEQPIGRPIIGNKKTISAFQKEDFQNYLRLTCIVGQSL